MRVQCYGHSAFHLSSAGASVAIDPFGDMSGLASRGIRFDYPALEGVEATLLLVTHEHFDHNGVEAISGDPPILRSTAGRLESHRTPRISFLDTADEFLERTDHVERVSSSAFHTADLPASDGPLVVVPAAP